MLAHDELLPTSDAPLALRPRGEERRRRLQPPRRQRRRRSPRGRAGRAALIVLAVLVALAVVLSVAAAGWVTHLAHSFNERTTTIANPFPSGTRPVADDGGALDILLIGSDSRQGTDQPDAGNVSGGRSDSMMLVHLSGDRKSADVMSIMRDSWVDVPGHGMAKINAAYAWGGVPLTVQTVEQLLDVRIDHVAEIGFAGFSAMTDALGGVDVSSSKAFTARGHEIHVGENHLDGPAALAFVRERYAFADADYQRVRNQQAFIRGIVDGLASKGTLTHPSRIPAFVAATADHLAVDPGLDARSIGSIAWSARDIRPGDVHYFTLPTAGGGTSADGQSYVTVNDVALGSLSTALRSDDVDRYLADVDSAR